MKFILGKKIEMSQRFRDDGKVVPVTLIEAGPSVVTHVEIFDGFKKVQIGFGHKKKINKPLKGHLKGLETFRYLREFKLETKDEERQAKEYKRGDKIDVSIFKPGDLVGVTGVSKGKGFAGVVRRHSFHGSPASHGHKDQLRMPGSIGATDPSHVFKGVRMAGRMGGGQVTVKNLEVVEVDPKKNLLALKGAVPGARNSLLMISSEIKKS